MKYDNDEIERIIGETSEERLLKKYISKMNKIFGEDYTTMILSSDYDINKSISKFTSKLTFINNHSLQYILLKQSLLSNSSLLNPFMEQLQEVDFKEYLFRVDKDLCFRKGLTRNLINNSSKENIDIFNSIEEDKDKEMVIENITSLRDYARFIHVQEYFAYNERKQYKKVKKRGNRR